jgi:hypothetical protein
MLHEHPPTSERVRRLDAASRARPAFHSFLLKQYTLQRDAFGADMYKYTPEERVESIKWNVLAAQAELAEVLGEVCWKPWATYDEGVVFKDRDKYVEELVDALHFIANLLILARVNDTELSRRFAEKQAVNAARQQTAGGYKGDGAAWDADHRVIGRGDSHATKIGPVTS